MAKTIRVSEVVYEALQEIQLPRESLGEIIARLLAMYELLKAAEPIIRGQHEFLESRRAEKGPTPSGD